MTMTHSPKSLTSLRCRTSHVRRTTGIYGWLVIALLLVFSIEYSNSQQEELHLLQPYGERPPLHAGVVRDFEALAHSQEEQESYSDVSGSGSEINAVENTEDVTDRMLQNEIGYCYDALYLADQNQDNKVDAEEFVTFAQIMGPAGFLPNSETYQELPLILQSNFIILACLCLQIPNFDGGTGVDSHCCAVDPHLDISGTQPGTIPTSKQSQYLYQVCFLTETSIDRLLLSATPTTEPSKPPASDEPTRNPTTKPTTKPTRKPTLEPSSEPSAKPSKDQSTEPSQGPTVKPTNEPTTVPTGQPTNKPTNMPSRQPTNKPTTKPSGQPTNEPTIKPSGEPTNEPTTKPSGQPTNEPTTMPTGQPTIKPTLEPSAKPSRNPTAEPSGKPTENPTDPLTSTRPPTPSLRPSNPPTIKDDNVSSSPVEMPSAGPTVTPVPVTELAIVYYGIAITNGKVQDIPPSSYTPDLINSMNIVAQDVAYSLNLGERENGSRGLQKQKQNVGVRRFLRPYQRGLATITTINLPTAVERLSEVECPSFFSSNDDCQTVIASVELGIAIDGDIATTDSQDAVQGLVNPSAVKDLFQESLNTAIESGALQAALIEVNPNTVVTITTGFIPTTLSPTPTISEIATSSPTSTPVPISGGGIAGIVLAGIGGLVIGFLIIAALRRRGLEASVDNSEDQFEQDDKDAGLKQGVMQDAKVTKLNQGGSGDVQADQSSTEVNEGTGVALLAATATVGATAVLAATSSEHDSQTNISADVSSTGKKKMTSDNLDEVPGPKAMVVDDASSAGESGWSSNQDGSSANTSIDNSLDSIPQSHFSGIVLGENVEGQMAHVIDDKATSLLVSPIRSQQTSSASRSLSPASGGSPQSQGNSYTGTTGTEGSIQSTYSELDDAIQKGDWAAVGVTAALLASQAYVDDNTQGSSKQSISRLRKQSNALNPERAAELDHLVETGDWEGVVAAAAKFDAQEALRGDAYSSQNSESGSAVDSIGGSSSAPSGSVGGSSTGTAPSNMSGSQTIDTTTSPSTYTATGLTATSDTASTRSKARKLNEIRDEVEALVTAVVPEEADNVDEMMTQFRGREEELVETLRSMQERQVAQKARKESQKQAKRQAKEFIQDRKKQETFEAVDNTGNTADDIWMQEIEDFDGSVGDRNKALKTPMETNEEAKAMKDQLQEAINNENWENVAEAAAGLSGHATSKGQSSSRDNESVVSNRSVDINALVDKGDWDGVVAAASRYAEGSTNASSSNDYTGEDTEELADDSTIEQRRKRREERLREEEEALAQAEIWDAIADQTKIEDNEEGKGASGNAGAAKMAADWAIDQSLAALKKAEEDHDDDSVDSSEDKKGDNESL